MSSCGLECSICMEIPEGTVYQCSAGHCFCAPCDSRLEKRECPECRRVLPEEPIRCRAQERAIAVLPANCRHCGAETTRGSKAAHERDCPSRPRDCVGAGCTWSGPLAAAEEHEKACPFVVCAQMIGPLQSEIQRLATSNRQLREELTIVRRQRQRTESPSDAAEPPHDVEIQQMDAGKAVKTLWEHVEDPRVALSACERLASLCATEPPRRAAMEVKGAEGVLQAMRKHEQHEGIQTHALQALSRMCFEPPQVMQPRCQPLVDAGTFEAAIAAMLCHTHAERVQLEGCELVRVLCIGSGAGAERRQRRAVEAGIIEALVAAMSAHAQVERVQEQALRALKRVCRGEFAEAATWRRQASGAGTVALARSAAGAFPCNTMIVADAAEVLGWPLDS